MKREQAREVKTAFLAFCEGRTIQYRDPDDSNDWWDDDDPAFENQMLEFRVKPKLIEVWIEQGCLSGGAPTISLSEVKGWHHLKEVND